ncbi:MAG: hypothetical protein ACT4PT_10715 [Methanobacteriota archaeon]
MSAATLSAGALLALLSATVFVAVGRRAQRERVPLDRRFDQTMFALWWYGLAGSTALGGLVTILALADALTLGLFLIESYLALAIVLVALWGLLYYLIAKVWRPRALGAALVGLYALNYLVIAQALLSWHAVGIRENEWNVALDYEDQTTGSLVVVLLLLVLPQLVAAEGNLALSLRDRDRTERFRGTIVSLAILVWFGSAIAAAVSGLSQSTAWQLASRLISLSAALVTLIAFEPPAWVRARFGLPSEGPSGRVA